MPETIPYTAPNTTSIVRITGAFGSFVTTSVLEGTHDSKGFTTILKRSGVYRLTEIQPNSQPWKVSYIQATETGIVPVAEENLAELLKEVA